MNINVRSGVGGAVSGAAMLACMMMGAARAGMPWDWPVRWITALLGGGPALLFAGQARGGMSAPLCIAVGLTIHAIVSIGLTRLFLMLAWGQKKIYLPIAGLIFGALIWAIMGHALLPMFDVVMAARVQLIPHTFLAANLAYGLVLGLACGAMGKAALH
jgi:hypothetical protein